jgi:DNA polymerase III subunit delta'
VSDLEGIGEADGLAGVPLPEHRARLLGQGAPWVAIERLLDGARLPSAIMLHGPRGIGKATLAFKAAEAIFLRTGDEDPTRVEGQMAAGSHPNLFVLRRQPKDAKSFYSVIRVDDIRALRERLRRTRGRAGYRVAVLDAIDDCNPSAANALLKTLEEPPSETIFLLISHRPGALLPTIRSRCHMLPMRPIDDGSVAAVLRETSREVSQDELVLAVSLAQGRPRRGFEALALGGEGALPALRGWLADPLGTKAAAQLAVADALGAGGMDATALFARDLLFEWCAGESRKAALDGDRARLASANALWDKAQALFAETESLNLDLRQSFTILLDLIRSHLRATAPAPESA